MTCEQCQDVATVHLTRSINGERREVHLCASCARKSGLSPREKTPDLGLDAVVQSLIVSHVGELVGELANLTCPECQLKYMEFRARGRLGCPHDYRIFARGLGPLLNRAHGATRHVGKVARIRPDAAERLRLRAQLREAVLHEDYELAARLRDQLRLKGADA